MKSLITSILLMMGVCLMAGLSLKPVGSYKTDVKGPIRIPFEMVDNKPVFDAEINGVAVRMMIDNGRLWDEIWFFGSPVVEKLGLVPEEGGTIGGAGSGDPTEATYTDGVTIRFGDVTFYDQECIISPASAGFTRMFPHVDGQISNTFFSHFQVEFDFEKNEVVLHRPETFQPRENTLCLNMTAWEDGGHSVPIRLEMSDGKVFEDIVDLDFGGINVLKLAVNEERGIVAPEKNFPATFGYGAQGPIVGHYGRIKSLTLGDITFENELVAFGNRQEMRIEGTSLGIIGLPLLSRFNPVFDYLEKRLYLTPNKFFRRKFEHNMSGMKVGYDYVVKEVTPGWAAEEAGIEVGDRIVEIEGEAMQGRSYYDYLNFVESRHGRRLKLLLDRDGKRIETTLILKRLI